MNMRGMWASVLKAIGVLQPWRHDDDVWESNLVEDEATNDFIFAASRLLTAINLINGYFLFSRRI